MNELWALKVNVRFRDGSRQELTVDAERALIGSGAHCEIRLPSEDSAVEQLAVSMSSGNLFGEVRHLERQVLVNGVPFLEGRLPPGAVVRIGNVELVIEPFETSLALSGKKHRENSGSPLIYALAVVGFPLGFYLLLTHPNDASALPQEVEPPALFAQNPEPCPQTDRAAAAAFAGTEWASAEAARERAPFDGKDGVNAALAFERAAACFTRAEDPARAEQARQAAAKLKQAVQSDFHVHRVRLERALATKAYEEARAEVHLLLSYVGRTSGEYASWLSSLDRQIQLKFVGKKAK